MVDFTLPQPPQVISISLQPSVAKGMKQQTLPPVNKPRKIHHPIATHPTFLLGIVSVFVPPQLIHELALTLLLLESILITIGTLAGKDEGKVKPMFGADPG